MTYKMKRSRPRSCGPSLNPPRLDRGQVRSGPVSIVRWKPPPGTATADPPIARFMNRNSPYKKWPRAWRWLSSVHVTMTCYAHWIPRTRVKKSPAVISPLVRGTSCCCVVAGSGLCEQIHQQTPSLPKVVSCVLVCAGQNSDIQFWNLLFSTITTWTTYPNWS